GRRIDGAQVRQIALSERADGIVVLNDDQPELIRSLASPDMPVVIVNGEDPAMLVDTVTPENRFGARLGIEHLLALGHR
ncbi:LacI family transcriptional regulator, partial [Rhizobium ruizarguesonis]